MRLALALVPLAACSFAPDDPVSHYVENEGRVCLQSSSGQVGSTVRYEADTPLIISYQTPGCLSQSCDTGRFATCSVSNTGTNLAITSAASWHSDESPGAACTDDCGTVIAQCETAPLPAGTYTFTFSSKSLTLTVPSTLPEPPCANTAM